MGTLSRLAQPGRASALPWLGLIAVIAAFGLWRAARAGRAGDELVGITLTGLVGSLISPVSWQHHLYWFVPALIVLLDVVATRGAAHRTWYAVVGVVVWTTVTVSLISFFDWGYLPASLIHTPEGFLVLNSYVLLMLVLLVVLPIRERLPDAPTGTAGSPG
jgi:alpha-1,2-mannosyltransferase